MSRYARPHESPVTISRTYVCPYEAYSATLVWGQNAKDGGPPVSVADGPAHEQRERLETIEHQPAEGKRMRGQIRRAIGTTGLEVSDLGERIREHKQRKEQPQLAAAQARMAFAARRQLLDSADVIAAFAEDMSAFLLTSDITETKAFIRTFVKWITVRFGRAVIPYTIPMPQDSPIRRSDSAEVGFGDRVLSSVRVGGASWTRTRDLRMKNPLLCQTELRARIQSKSPTPAALAPLSSPAQRSVAPMTEPFKVGLIGTGSISRAHLPVYQLAPDRVRLTAVCDIRADAARQFAADAQIDAVDIGTIHDTHAPLAIAAARAGKHVLLEKPMAVSIDECRQIIEATEQAGVTFMVAQQLRHVPSYMALRRRIQAGELGQIWSARCDTFLAAALTDNLASGRPRQGWWGFDGKRGGGGVVDVTVPGVGRNDDCPCGSGKKYKRCHDATATRDRRIVDRMQRD